MKFQCRLTARNLIASEQTARKMAFCLARDDDRLSDSAPEKLIEKVKKSNGTFDELLVLHHPNPLMEQHFSVSLVFNTGKDSIILTDFSFLFQILK